MPCGGITRPASASPATGFPSSHRMEQGLLLVPAGTNVVRFVPPLTIKPRHVREAVKRLEKALLACQTPTPSAA